ncbi:hypothetical protein [Flavobacterium sp.]|jgi:hypothetical protein|uniref:hypothetical protein n=1 Tax=Flavobacterium sp. TaxID=239 RepID=UPI0037C0C71F
MSATPQNTDNQELDLSQISRKIGEFFEGISNKIFKGILFIKRNIVWVGALFVLGLGLGIYLDKTNKVYNHQIIVTPNFGSVDYLYAKVDLINSKVKESDTLFLRDVVGIKNPKSFKGIEVEPITDVYKFIENKTQNFELIKLLAEDGDIKKIVNETLTSKNYPYHLISYSTNGLTSDEATTKPLMAFLNNSEYFLKVYKEYNKNITIKMAKNDSIISQIDAFLNSFNNTVNGSQKSDKLIYYNENSQLGDIIKTKDALLNEQGIHRLELVNLDKIIKDSSITLNIKNTKKINGKMKLVLPLFFVGMFIFFSFLKRYYNNQMAKIKV